MIVEGLLYASIALLGAFSTGIGTDEAAKFIDPKPLFWLRMICGVIWQTLLAIKTFRSESFSRDKQEKQAIANKGQPGQIEIATQVTQAPPVVTSQVVTNPPKPEPNP
jgi:hypothetical protein